MAAFVLGVDLDGVVGDFYGAIRMVAAEWRGKPVEDLDPEVRFGLAEWGFTPETYPAMHRFGVTQRGLFRELEPIDGAPSTLRRLSDDGIHIRIITHRLFIPHFHQEAVQQTIEWLDYYGIPYRDLCFTGDKVAVGADMYVEDTATNVEALRKVAPTIVFTNSTNRHLDEPRADTWEDVERLVREERESWLEREDSRHETDITGN
jgi:5'(3')-deoxyribonucleotidase